MNKTDDCSKYFPHALALMAELQADAVLVCVIGGRLGHGAAPALALNKMNTPGARHHNTIIVRSLITALTIMAEQLEADVLKSGIQLEPKQ